MNWNIYNSLILIGAIGVLFFSISKWFLLQKDQATQRNFFGFIVASTITIVQVILIDIGIPKRYPVLYLFYFPSEFLAPYFFLAFTCNYLEKKALFNKVKYYLLAPFLLFFLLYTILKINVFSGYQIMSRSVATYIQTEIIENTALFFALLLGIANYQIIRNYEISLGNFPYIIVLKKTKWLKNIYVIMIALNIFWLLILVWIKIDDTIGGNATYYPLWISFLIVYYYFYFKSKNHLTVIENNSKTTEQNVHNLGLNQIFSEEELVTLHEKHHQFITILSYFATSLYDKTNTDEVLWDITENCISKLDLEDCVIYIKDEKQDVLIQKAAYGNKNKIARKILNPINIPVGKGIVGTVAKTGKPEIIADLQQEERYIQDDAIRLSELAVPIFLDTKLIGVIDTEHSQKNYFTNTHLYLFRLIAKLTEKKLMQLLSKKTLSITNDNVYFKEICHLMQTEKLYRNPELKLKTISDKINISSNYISQLINKLSACNFSDFVNQYRIADVKRKLLKPEFRSYPIVSIGLEAGFNSKSTFYSAFKKHTGISPTAYRDKVLYKS